MKKFLLMLTFTTALLTTTGAHAQRHRHNPQTIAQATETDTTVTTARPDTAYIDNITATTEDDNREEVACTDKTVSFKDVHNPLSLIGYLSETGTGGTIVAIFFVLLCILVMCSPFILAGTIVYMRTKVRRKRYEVIEKAIENGYKIPQELIRQDEYTNAAMLKKGIKNTSIGLGLAVLFMIMGAEPLIGIGFFVALYGVGQIVTSKKVRSGNDNDGNNIGNHNCDIN